MNVLRSLMTGVMIPVVFAAVPTTVNYQLRDYGFGNGSGTSSTSNYSIQSIAGEQSGDDMSTVTYTARPGLESAQLANVPPAPTITNPTGTYNKLHVVINTGSNPSDALFAIAISTDNFVSTKYVQDDDTVGNALGLEDYQTYSAWGGASGFDVIGLDPNTTYTMKVKATQGDFSETGYGPTASLATADLTLTFDIDVSATDTPTSPPYSVSFGSITSGTVTSSPTKVWFSLDTNAASGARIFIISQNAGLKSTATSYTISSASADLSIASEGYGAQAASATQSSGGPFTSQSPYNGASQNVGIIDATYRTMFSTAGPITSGRSSFVFKAKTAATTPAATDYADLYTAVAAPSF